MKLKSLTPKDLMSEIKGMDIKMADIRFTDIPGTTQHFTIPIKFKYFHNISFKKVNDFKDLA